MEIQIKKEGRFQYVEEGDGEVLLLLHGLFGALSNFKPLFDYFKKDYKVVIPMLPIYELPVLNANLTGLVKYVNEFVAHKQYKSVNVIGNSLGGHIAILFALENLPLIHSILLTGSSGLFENAMGSTFPKRGSYEYIKKKTEDTFYDPKTATKELIDEVFGIVNDRMKALKVLKTAKSAIRHNVGNRLGEIDKPVLLIWGKNDKVTPLFVGEEFHKLLPNSELISLNHCGHAPMMEKPDEFNQILESFLNRIYS